MEKTRLLSNLPLENLTNETDYLGILEKGDLIKSFLVGNKEQFNEIKMFSLYGEWGSGKSSLMKYLEKELKSEFNTFFFEAWEFEKDENLSMSLLEFMTAKNLNISKEVYDDINKYGGRILRGLGKSIKLNIPLFTNGPALELDPSAFVEEVTKSEELTFYNALKSFKTEFVRFEDEMTNGKNPKHNVVFIDDLDRCEPEQVLNLLSAIKLFFTYGKKTIFFCGVDKKAVEQAVKTKYGKIVKANEYLEKIFDISFTMPEHEEVLKLISLYFDDRNIEHGNFKGKLNEKVADFFISIKFTNPRRLKKVLNKYLILQNFKIILRKEENFSNQIPNIIIGKEGNFFETILTLYIICISEFYKKTYNVFNDLNLKSKLIKKAIEIKYSLSEKVEYNWEVEHLASLIKNDFFYDKGFKSLKDGAKNLGISGKMGYYFEGSFLIHFIDGTDSELNKQAFSEWKSFQNNYNASKIKIDYLFVKYLFLNTIDIIEVDNLSDFKLGNFKKMIDKFL